MFSILSHDPSDRHPPSEANSVPSALQHPAASVWPRPPVSARRTSHIDMTPTGGTSQDGLIMRGSARDAVTDADGDISVAAEASIQAEVGPDRALLSLTPTPPGAASLIGHRLGTGFRAAVKNALPAEASGQTALYLLLDDLPVASLISGYADVYAGLLPPRIGAASLRSQADICAGWATGATMLRTIEDTGEFATPVGPPAPALEDPDDPDAWHPVPALAVGAMRRRRLVELTFGDGAGEGSNLRIRAMFRDTHVGPDGVERVLHEYRLTAEADRSDGTVTHCTAEPMVLPWPECPIAAGSAAQLVGRRATGVREHVRRNLRGTSTCTHLNDLLRSLGDVVPLGALLGLDLSVAG